MAVELVNVTLVCTPIVDGQVLKNVTFSGKVAVRAGEEEVRFSKPRFLKTFAHTLWTDAGFLIKKKL